MNADYIKSVVDKANELIALIESAAANPKHDEAEFQDWLEFQEGAIGAAKQAVYAAVRAETIN